MSRKIEDLIRRRDWFGSGSRIIITTRDMQLLRAANVDESYHVKGMSFNDALQLFSINAFKQDLPIKDYMELSKEAMNYCEGNPLALKVLGSFLYSRTDLEWESTLRKLQNAPHKEIFDVLKLSFDGLDHDEKEIFLDIALFHDGKKTRDVKDLLVSCGFFAEIGITVVVDRSLIAIRDDCVVMHDLIKAIGREIVCQPNIYKSGKRRRLWKDEDIYRVLKSSKGNEEIYGMSLNVSKIKETYLRHDAFENMDNLQILKFYHPYWQLISSRLHIPNGIGNLPEELRCFQWNGYPHRSVPLNSCASNIVELIMPSSHVKQLWEEKQHLPNLKTIKLEDSKHLVGIADLSAAPNLRYLDVSGCKSLSQVYSSGLLPNLQNLYINNCDALKIVNLGGKKVDRRRWRQLAVNEFFIWNYFRFHKMSMRILKSDCRNSYSVRFNSASVPVTGISESEFESKDTGCDNAMQRLLHGTLKSVLPNIKLLRLSDKSTSLETIPERLRFRLMYREIFEGNYKRYEMLSTFPELDESLMERFLLTLRLGMKETRNKEAVLPWDWEEDFVGTDDNLTEHNIYICNCRLSKIPGNKLRWNCLTQVSLYRSDILNLQPASPSSLNSPLLYDYTRTQCAMELTFSLDNLSEESFNLVEQPNLDHMLIIHFHANGWKKYFRCGNYYNWNPSTVDVFLELQ